MSISPEEWRVNLENRQLVKLRRLSELAYSQGNAFITSRLPREVTFEAFRQEVPFMTKAELLEDHERHPPFGSNLNFPIEHYTRYCQTSGTSGEPMPWLDTNESWQGLLECWKRVYQAAELSRGGERVFFAFSFGPFLGFWTAFEAAVQLGYLAIPGGGMSGLGRLKTMERTQATVLCCTPTYAQRLGGQLQEEGIVLPRLKKILVAGEPGGSIPATRDAIEKLWGGAKVFDHHGLTEVGPVSFESAKRPGILEVMEETYLAEVIHPETSREVSEGEEGELVITTLDRLASPLVRYRTGDLVQKALLPELGLKGGILGRLDDMVLVRGVNVYPAAVEGVVRRYPEVMEYQVVEMSRNAMVEIELEIEVSDGNEGVINTLADDLRQQLQLRIPVKQLPVGTLPRYEFKAKRWHKRHAG